MRGIPQAMGLQRPCAAAAIVALAVVIGTGAGAVAARDARLSGGVAFPPASVEHAAFVAQPGVGYVEAHMRFGPDLADDVIMFIDQEFLEGVTNQRWVKGGDWMAFVGVQRAGGVWVGGGTDQALAGTPSQDRNWAIYDLQQRLQPNVWYRLRVEADFAARRFKTFTIQGGSINRTIDLSAVKLDYPNYMPFDRPSMIYVVGAMRNRSMMKVEGTPLVSFDDVEGGVVRADGTTKRFFFDDFEASAAVATQPIASPPIRLDTYNLGRWYLERSDSIFRIESATGAKSGGRVGVADANLGN